MTSSFQNPISNDEYKQVLVDWNQTQVEFPVRSLPDLFLEQVSRTPHAIAVQSGAETLTYSALNERANQLANHLQTQGVGAGSLVAICLDRSLDLIISILAVLKAGGAYIPLDPAYPSERLDFMLSDSKAVSLITHIGLRGKLTHFEGHLICLDVDWPVIQQQSSSSPADSVLPHNLAYIIYTSGSTGQPKGVMVEQYGWANYVLAARQTYQLGPGERVLQFASISWDTSAEEIFPCLTSGATLVLRSADMIDSISRFLQNCEEWKVNVINIPTAFWHELVTQLSSENLALPSSLRVVIIGGERAQWEMLLKWREHSTSNIHLFNTYGQTECTAITTCVELTPAATPDAIPLGRPVQNVTAYVLDEHLMPVPVGEPGELYVGGAGLARGYLNQPELTTQKFIANPFVESAGRLYKTGDLVRYWADGNLEFVGRADHQVKIRGIRIEPGEIEAVLLQHPAVQSVAVVGHPIGPSPEYLAAYVVWSIPQSSSPAELRGWLAERLPNYLVPSVIQSLDALPLTPNGKLDRRALPVPNFSQRAAGADDNEPLTDSQAELKLIWQEVLGLPSVGLHDNFFEIGGHSLLATRVVARVRQRFQIDLPLRVMFNAPTIADLSEEMQAIAPVTDEPTLSQRSLSDPLYASFAQESLWFLDQMAPGNPAYNISDALRLTGKLDVPILEQAINALVQRHEILRTVFTKVDGQPVPFIIPKLQIPLPVIEAPSQPEFDQLEFVRSFGADEAMRPFDLGTGPLLRVTLARLTPTSHVLIIVTHHIISDGWSIAVFFQELSKLYTALVNKSSDSLPDLPIQFADYALWQRSFLQGDRLDSHLGYWKEKLRDITPFNFPLDRPRPPLRSFRGARIPVKFSAGLTYALQVFSHSEEATLFMLLLAALQATIVRHTSQTDITLGTAIANRHQPELDDLIGFFVNTLVLRTDLSGDPTFHEILSRVKETTLNAYQHQVVPFELIVKALQPRRVANRNPMFDAMLFLQNVPPPKLDLPGVRAEFLELEQRTSEFDFVLDLTETPDGLQGFCEYDTDLFDFSTMSRFISHFQTLLVAAVRNPDEQLSRLQMLSQAEHRQLVTEWNQNTYPLSASATIPDLFEEQAARTPEKIAAICGDESITYQALNARANQLANYLQANGVQKETVVGICLDRSIDLLVALFGILKAGAAYLPLDPAYPLDRLQFMLNDSQALQLITSTNHLPKFTSYGGRIIQVDADAFRFSDQPMGNLMRDLNGENACYIIYTSGSTGHPKGVVGLHRAAINRFQWMWETYPFSENEVCAQKTALSFVDSVWETFGPLLRGMPLVIIPDAELKDTRRFVEVLAQTRVTRIVLVPSLLRLMFETYPDLQTRLPDLRLWVSSGEMLTRELADEFLNRLPGRILLNLYGSSEVAADSTAFEVKQVGAPVSIGRPIFNTEAYILDSYLHPVPIGVAGDIYIGGSGLARGYWLKPDLTAERFLPHPFNNEPGARIYKTGDIGRYWADGNIEYVGRSDFQVKIRGFRVELGEVQNVLLQHPAVKQVLVVTGAVADGQRLIAYLVPNPDSASTVDYQALRKFAEGHLPDYMIPSAWVTLDKFPLTPSGKIDQRALPSPNTVNIESSNTYVAPRDELELRLVKLWEQLLERSPIGIEDNFFDVGGHSMLVVRLMTQLEKEFNKSLSLALIFHAPTIALMASALRDQGWKPTWSSLVPIRSSGSLPPLFCVHADGGAFFYTSFADYLSENQPFYGLQARGLDGSEPPFARVEDMAAHYVSEIRSVQPRGPYIISGFSMGGVVIYEMAQNLVAAGEPYPLVIFLDAPSPTYFEEQDKRISGKLINLTRLSPQARFQRMRLRLGQRYRWLANEFLTRLFLKFNYPLTPALRIHRVREMNHRIADEYDPKPYAGPITILRASEQIRRATPDPTLGWSDFVTGEITDYVIPGDHETIFQEPNVQVMAQTLQSCIDLAIAGQKTK